MSYTKQNFVSGQVLKAEHLNRMEDGIVALEEDIPTAQELVDALPVAGEDEIVAELLNAEALPIVQDADGAILTDADSALLLN